jgi:hypothetical protein
MTVDFSDSPLACGLHSAGGAGTAYSVRTRTPCSTGLSGMSRSIREENGNEPCRD